MALITNMGLETPCASASEKLSKAELTTPRLVHKTLTHLKVQCSIGSANSGQRDSEAVANAGA